MMNMPTWLVQFLESLKETESEPTGWERTPPCPTCLQPQTPDMRQPGMYFCQACDKRRQEAHIHQQRAKIVQSLFPLPGDLTKAVRKEEQRLIAVSLASTDRSLSMEMLPAALRQDTDAIVIEAQDDDDVTAKREAVNLIHTIHFMPAVVSPQQTGPQERIVPEWLEEQ